MRIMILAAGLGKRMLPLTKDCPKPLLKIGKHALIEHHLHRLSAAGFKDIVINVSYHRQMIQDALGDGSAYGVNIQYSIEQLPLETAGGICHALPLLGDESFAIINSDIWTDYPFEQLHQHAHRPCHLVMIPNPPQHPKGDFYLLDQQLRTDPPGQRLTYSGIAVYHPSIFKDLVPGIKHPLRPCLRQAISTGIATGEHYPGVWQDIGTPARLAELRDSEKQAIRQERVNNCQSASKSDP